MLYLGLGISMVKQMLTGAGPSIGSAILTEIQPGFVLNETGGYILLG